MEVARGARVPSSGSSIHPFRVSRVTGLPLSSEMFAVTMLLPRAETLSVTEEVAPFTRLTSTTRAMTPMMMPSMVSTARIFPAEMERRAILKDRIISSPP